MMNTSEITIKRAVRSQEQPYFVTARKAAQDKALSYEAAGLLWYLLSKPDNWRVKPQTLIREGCKRNRVYALLTELIDARYIQRTIQRDKFGRIADVEYEIYEHPLPQIPDVEKQDVEIPDVEIPDVEIPDVENRHNYKRQNQQKTDSQKRQNQQKTDKTLPANPEQAAVAVVESLSVYVIPELTDKDTWESETQGEPGQEKWQPAEARAVVPVETAPVILKHNDFAGFVDDEIILGLKPEDPPLFKTDRAWAQVQKKYEGVIGGAIGPKMQSLLEDGIEQRGLEAVIEAIEKAPDARKSRYGYLAGTLQNWRTDKPPEGGRTTGAMPPRREVDNYMYSMWKS